MSLNSNATYSASNLQPKFKECQLAAGFTKPQLRTWMSLIASVVSNIPGGKDLQVFVDTFCGRKNYRANVRPSFLSDPRLQDDSITITTLDSEVQSTADSQATESQAASGAYAEDTVEINNYSDLPQESKTLDLQLHSTLLTIVKGTYYDVVSSLEGPDARYSFAIIALWKHASLDDSTRRLSAMKGMENLTFNGDGAKWKMDFIKTVKEVYDSKLTLEHWIMHCAFKSFEGKNQQVQSMIVKHINNEKLIAPGMNFDAIATEYSSFISTMNAGKHGKVNFTQDVAKDPSKRGNKDKMMCILLTACLQK